MGWLIDLAKAAGPEPMPAAGANVETSDPAVLWWRIAITEPGGRTVEVDAPSGWSLADWQAYAARYHSPGCIVTPIAALPKAQVPVNLDEVLAGACEGVAGITPAQFRGLLSPEGLQDIEGGDLPVETLKAYALSFSEGVRTGRIGAPVHVCSRGAKPDPASGSIVVITDAELEAARKGRTGWKP